MHNAIQILGSVKIQELVHFFSSKHSVPEYLGIAIVCNACCSNPDLAPDCSNKGTRSPEESVEQWVIKFKHAYDERISQRCSRLPGTVPDQAVEIIINSALPFLSIEQANCIIYAHRLAMSAENILGLLLEEFLFLQLQELGWAMAWGETIKSVDFCHISGALLQVKNRSNSENSSSNKIRNGKPIVKWYRVNAHTGECEWNNLLMLINRPDFSLRLSEENFRTFIKVTLQNNPNALAIEPTSPWISFKGK